MSKFILRCLKISTVVLAAACRSTTEPADLTTCQQTYEFGNYGCARVVVIVDEPTLSLPAARRWVVAAMLIDSAPGISGGFAYNPGPGSNVLEFTQYYKLPNDSTETYSAWVSARVLDETIKNVSPLPVIAVDSVLHVFRFAPVGTRPVVDTVRLTLRR